MAMRIKASVKIDPVPKSDSTEIEVFTVEQRRASAFGQRHNNQSFLLERSGLFAELCWCFQWPSMAATPITNRQDSGRRNSQIRFATARNNLVASVMKSSLRQFRRLLLCCPVQLTVRRPCKNYNFARLAGFTDASPNQ